MTTTTTVVLPYTEQTVSASLAEFTITSLKQMNTRDGVAYNGTLRRNGKIVGTLENDGHGGGTFPYFNTGDTWPIWNAAVAESAPHLTTAELGDAFASECACDALIDEYDTGRLIKRAAKKGETVVRRPANDEWSGPDYRMYASANVAAIVAAERQEGGEFAVWADDHWDMHTP